ncbi:hypothetical protein D3C76_1222560 [compost metagenome]
MHAVLEQCLAIGGVAAVHRRYIGGFQRVGQQLHRYAFVGMAGQVEQAGLAGHEVGRDQDQFVLDIVQVGRQLLSHQQLRVGLIAGQDLARRVPERLVMGPDQLVAPHIQARPGLVGHQPVIECLALDPCFSQ